MAKKSAIQTNSTNDQKYTFNVDGTYVFDDKYESSHQLHQLTFPDENPHRGLFNVTDHNNENKFPNFTYRVFSTGMKNMHKCSFI
mgnify:CR=1 FL=1